MKKAYTLIELTAGMDVEIRGDSQCIISGVSTIQGAKSGQITFLMNPLYKKYLADTEASAVILCPNDAEACKTTAVISRDPYYTYAKIAAFFEHKPLAAPGVHPTAVIGEGCKIHPTASIGAYAVIGNDVAIGPDVVIGSGCVISDGVEIDEKSRLDARVTLYHGVTIGKRVVIASGAVIGSDGFGLAKHAGVWHKVPQLGRVILEDDVEIGANCAIDRGAIDDTVIERGAKLDNLIQIGHNVRIGENTALAGCVGVAGSATIGKNCLIGGGSGVNGHISIADNVMITGMTAVSKTIREAGVYSSGVGGVITNLEWRKNSARLHRLDQLQQRVKALELLLEELSEKVGSS